MKIRTDFVTNSSSSSFVCAHIEVNDEKLVKLMECCSGMIDVNFVEADEDEPAVGTIEFNDYETGFGFRPMNRKFMRDRESLKNPETVITKLLKMAEAFCTDDKQKREIRSCLSDPASLADTITSYNIRTGYSGSSGDADTLCGEYVEAVAKEQGLEFDPLWDQFLDSREWATEHYCYSFDREDGNSAQEMKFLSGPLGTVNVSLP